MKVTIFNKSNDRIAEISNVDIIIDGDKKFTPFDIYCVSGIEDETEQKNADCWITCEKFSYNMNTKTFEIYSY